jgi:hypothetical protein
MKYITLLSLFTTTVISAHALIINEIVSNPAGDDSGREWVEVYNASDVDVDISSLTLSIKGATGIPVFPVSGGTVIAPHSYGIIASTVSGVTRFAQDYPTYSGPLVRSTMSLVNTGVTSLEIKLQGISQDILTSYTAAKEGSSLSLFPSGFQVGIPSPGEENKQPVTSEETVTTTQSSTQSLLPQATPPAADIVLYLQPEKTVVAGAPSLFTVVASTRSGKQIDNMLYVWGFGDGGYGTGSSTLYRYLYPGRYIAQVEGTNGLIAGSARMTVRVVSPDISISPIGSGKYGQYIDITNPNEYDIDMSMWKITIDGVPFSFPKHTILSQGTTRFPGSAMGFASTTVSSSTVIRLLFQNMDEVLRITQGTDGISTDSVVIKNTVIKKSIPASVLHSRQKESVPVVGVQVKNTKESIVKELPNSVHPKDTRMATFFKSFFGR